jgi:hypothetical protein
MSGIKRLLEDLIEEIENISSEKNISLREAAHIVANKFDYVRDKNQWVDTVMYYIESPSLSVPYPNCKSL